MVALHVSVDDRAVRRVLKDRKRRRIPQALASALNRGSQASQTASRRELSTRLGVPQKVLRRRILRRGTRKANRRKLRARFLLGTLDLPARYLKGAIRQGPAGARVGRRQFAGSFVTDLPSGGKGVYRRKGRARLPIEHVTVEFDGAQRVTEEKLRTVGGPTWKRRFAHEMSRIAR